MKLVFEHHRCGKVAPVLCLGWILVSGLPAQNQPANDANAAALQPATPAPPTQEENKRILGVIPNFQTVNDPNQPFRPLTVKQKFGLFAKETFDPFVAGAGITAAAISQIDNDDPKYGVGAGPYAQRFGAAVADITTQNFFSDAVLSSLLHEDPRYFRKGPEFGFWNRLSYAVSRVFVTRTDAGNTRFNFSGIGGMSMGIALSNAYYPGPSVNGAEVGTRFGTSLIASALGNILPEFWPDIHERLFRHKTKPPQPQATPPNN